jgi:translation initiation factor IF-1
MKSFRAVFLSIGALSCLLPGHVNAQLNYKRDGADDTSTTNAERYGGGQDHTGSISLSGDGTAATLSGNAWKAFQIKPYEIKYHTKLTFSAELIEASEVSAICLDVDKTYGNQTPRCFAFGGTQNIANDSNFRHLDFGTVGGGSKDYVVHVGHYFTGIVKYIAVLQDKDSNRTAGKMEIKNISIFEGDTSNSKLSYKRDDTDATSITNAESYGGGQDHTGIVSLSEGGKVAELAGNAWKAFKIEPYDIKYHTKLTFSAELIEASEVSAICLDVDKTYGNQRPRCFAFGGTQNVVKDSNFKHLDFGTVGGGFQDYEAYVGRYFTGTVQYITFMQDKDSNRSAGRMKVKNINILEGDAFTVDAFGFPVELDLVSYGINQDHGKRGVTVGDDGNSVTVEGNAWKAFPFDFTIYPDTILQFTFTITELSEAVALCLDEDLKNNQKDGQCLTVSGTQDISKDPNFQMLRPQLSEGETHTYTIRPADYQLQGDYKYLALLNDKDSNRDDGIATLSDVKFIDPDPSCLATKSWSFTFNECSSTNLLASLQTTFDSQCQNSDNSFEIDVFQFFDGDISGGIGKLCDSTYLSISFEDAILEEEQFVTEYFDGGTKWNYEVDEHGEDLRVSASRVDYVYENLADKYQISFPDSHQFDTCKLRSAMCCFVADRQANDNNGNCADGNCDDADPADNTDLCYVDMSKSQRSAHVRDGYSIYKDDIEGPVHCHGLAWGDNNGMEDTFKGNNLFFVSMYDHLYTRGYVEEVQGAPMCGCIEEMPVVSRADCTQVNIGQSVTLSYDAGDKLLTGSSTINNFEFAACQGADNTNNDLAAYYQQLVNDGKATAGEKESFDRHIVGEGNCDDAIKSFLDTKFLKIA